MVDGEKREYLHYRYQISTANFCDNGKLIIIFKVIMTVFKKAKPTFDETSFCGDLAVEQGRVRSIFSVFSAEPNRAYAHQFMLVGFFC